MKSIRILSALCLFLSLANFAGAQSSVPDMVKEWERAKAYTKQYLDSMPDAGYSLKPTPEMRSFAEQMLHLSDANYLFASVAGGDPVPTGMGASEKATDKSKANTIKMVLGSYDFVIAEIKKMTPAKANETVKVFGRFDMSRSMAFAKCFEHQTHHRGQTTVYIRLAGARPPQEQLF